MFIDISDSANSRRIRLNKPTKPIAELVVFALASNGSETVPVYSFIGPNPGLL